MENTVIKDTTVKHRWEWIDFARATAILCVVLCHSIGSIYPLDTEYIAHVPLTSRLYVFSLFTIGRLGVPLFLYVSGYLLLDRTYSTENCISFWRHNWLRLFVTIEIWIIFYYIFLCVWFNQAISIKYLLEGMSFIREVNLSHIWYMPMILGMYMLFPYVANALQSIRIKALIFPIVIVAFIAFVIPSINVILTANQIKNISTVDISLGFSGGCYGLYIITGYLVKRRAFKDVKRWLLSCIAVISFIMCIGTSVYTYSHGYRYSVWYDSIFLLLLSATIFELMSRMENVKLYRLVRKVSYYSFAIYLIHNVLCSVILSEPVALLNCSPLLKVIILWILSTIVSMAGAMIINRIPRVGKLLLYTK